MVGLRVRSQFMWYRHFGTEWKGWCSPFPGSLLLSQRKTYEKPIAVTKASLRYDVLRRFYNDRARGYLAGLHSYQPQQVGETESDEDHSAEFESFESAWEAIQSVPDNFLKDFEDELWATQSKRFVYGSKDVSVIDAVVKSAEPSRDDLESPKGTKIFRYLVWNERPNLIQTAVEVSRVGAPYEHYYIDGENTTQMLARPPSPISQTHLGGLAMALPFWLKANYHPKSHSSTLPKSSDRPNCALIGAGGCSLAHTLAANLFLEEYNQHSEPNRKAKNGRQNPQLTAVEASSEIMNASMLWFGAGTHVGEKNTVNKNKSEAPEPPFFHLVQSTGELYLESLVKSFAVTKENSDTSSDLSPIDILIIDAEDGSAPPQSMRRSTFWKDLVLPSMNHDRSPVIGVNSIGTASETSELVCTMREAFCEDINASGLSYRILVVAPPPEAKVTDRHKLIFVLPQRRIAPNDLATDVSYWSLTEDDLKAHVDVPVAWKQEIERALLDSLGDEKFLK